MSDYPPEDSGTLRYAPDDPAEWPTEDDESEPLVADDDRPA